MDTNRTRQKWIRNLRGTTLLAILFLILTACQGNSPTGSSTQSGGSTNGVKVEVVYLNHPPVRPIIDEINKVLASYGDKVNVSRYDFDTPEGEAFAKKMGITGHTPLAIFIEGSETFDLGGRKVKFESFPQGGGTGMVPDGAWSMTDLDSVLKAKVEK